MRVIRLGGPKKIVCTCVCVLRNRFFRGLLALENQDAKMKGRCQQLRIRNITIIIQLSINLLNILKHFLHTYRYH